MILEPTAQQLVDATSTPPFPYELDYATARKLLDDIQAGPVEKLPIDEEWITVPAAVGDARVRIITPRVVREGAVRGLDGTRIAVAGDSVGGNMATVLTLMAKDRGDVRFVQAQMYYPVTDAAMDTDSYEQFADGPYITRKAMEWFWDAYVADPAQRFEVTASPNLATIEQLRGLPPTLLLVDEADVLRDEGEAYAAKLRFAGVPVTTVRYDGICHDFMNLNALSQTSATRAAIAQAIAFFRQAFDGASGGVAR